MSLNSQLYQQYATIMQPALTAGLKEENVYFQFLGLFG